MIFLSWVILKLVGLLACAVLPGLGLIRLLDFQCRSRLDLALAVGASGIAAAGCGVYLLLLAGLYYPLAAWLMLLAPAGWLIYQYWRTGRLLPPMLAPEAPPAMPSLPPAPAKSARKKTSAAIALAPAPVSAAPPQPAAAPQAGGMSALDAAAVFVCGFLLLMDLLEAATSPLHSWDAVITWDKWATEWASRTNLYHALQGGYPQLLPMFSSLLYKITRHPGPLPQEQYALHAWHPLLGVLLLVACVRVAQLFELPAWGVLAGVFGFKTLRTALSAGGADLLVTLMSIAAPVLFVAWQKRQWNARWRGAPLWIACLFGAAFSKATGLLPMLLLPLANMWRPAGARFLRKPALACLLLAPVLLLVPFYWSQYAASRRPIGQMNPQEVSFRFIPAWNGFQKTIDAAYIHSGGWERFREAGQKFLADYALPPPFTDTAALAPGLFLLALAVASAWNRRLRPVLLTAVVLLAAWYRMASYDLRNLLPALPLLSLCVVAGALRLSAYLARFRGARFVLTGLLGLCAVPVASGIAWEAAETMQSTLLKDNLSTRLAAAEAGFPESARPFFPAEYELAEFLSREGFLARARHTVAASILYRWVPGGIYGASDWDTALVEQGDLFIGPLGLAPPGSYDRWTVLRTIGGLRAFLVERDPVAVPLQNVSLTGASPPRLLWSSPEWLDAEAGGNQSLMVYNLPRRETRAGFTVVWQVTVQAAQQDPALQPCSQLYNPSIEDPGWSAASIDLEQLGSRIVKYSGVLAIRPVVLSTDPRDGILFGVCRTGAPQTVRLRAFRYSVYPR